MKEGRIGKKIRNERKVMNLRKLCMMAMMIPLLCL